MHSPKFSKLIMCSLVSTFTLSSSLSQASSYLFHHHERSTLNKLKNEIHKMDKKEIKKQVSSALEQKEKLILELSKNNFKSKHLESILSSANGISDRLKLKSQIDYHKVLSSTILNNIKALEDSLKLLRQQLQLPYDSKMSESLAVWGAGQNRESSQSLTLNIDIPKFSQGTESNYLTLFQGTIGGDIVNFGFFYDGSYKDSSGAPSRSFVIRRWINAPPSGADSLSLPELCSNNISSGHFKNKIIQNSQIKQKFCFTRDSLQKQILPVHNHVMNNANSLEIFSELNWMPGKYQVSLTMISPDYDGDWYSFDIKDASGISSNLGVMKFSKASPTELSDISSAGISYSLLLSESAPIQSFSRADLSFKFELSDYRISGGHKISGQKMVAVPSIGNYVIDHFNKNQSKIVISKSLPKK